MIKQKYDLNSIPIDVLMDKYYKEANFKRDIHFGFSIQEYNDQFNSKHLIPAKNNKYKWKI